VTDKPVYAETARPDSQAEAPATVYGRLLESAHISGYSFERVCAELEWLLEEDRWRSVGPGYDDINAFVRSVDLSPFNMKTAPRQKLVKRLAELEASGRATAKMLGVNHKTVQNDRGEKSPRQRDPGSHDQHQSNGSGEKSPPERWFQRDHRDVVRPAEQRTKRLARDQEAAERREGRARATAEAMASPRGIDLRCGDFREVLADIEPASIDAIITDPPYGQKWLPLLTDLARFADRVLSPIGLMAILYGHTWLPDAFRLLDGFRPYRWTACYLMGGPAFSSVQRGVQSGWKPVLLYGGGRRFDDVIRNADTNSAAKDLHQWGQGLDGFVTLVERLTDPTDIVCDPMMGAGTTLVAANALGRHVLGCDIDPDHVKRAQERLL